MAGKVLLDHGDRVLAVGDSGAGGLRIRLLTPQGYSDFALEVEEIAPLVELFQATIAEDAQRRLEKKEEAAATVGSYPGFTPTFRGGSGA